MKLSAAATSSRSSGQSTPKPLVIGKSKSSASFASELSAVSSMDDIPSIEESFPVPAKLSIESLSQRGQENSSLVSLNIGKYLGEHWTIRLSKRSLGFVVNLARKLAAADSFSAGLMRLGIGWFLLSSPLLSSPLLPCMRCMRSYHFLHASITQPNATQPNPFILTLPHLSYDGYIFDIFEHNKPRQHRPAESQHLPAAHILPRQRAHFPHRPHHYEPNPPQAVQHPWCGKLPKGSAQEAEIFRL